MAVDFTAWLSDNSAARCILVEVVASVSSVETTRYLSSRPYRDETAGRTYQPVILGNSVRIVERLGVTGNASINYGDIEIQNISGDLDSWLNDVWMNRAVSAYIGDITWDRADFVPIFIGITEDIDSKDNETLNLKVRDKMQRLNTPVTENTLGGSTENKNELIPLCFGECHNVTPLLADPSTLDYRVHDGPIEAIKEVRSNGVPASTTDTLSSGKFVPDVNPQGTKLTVDVQGDDLDGSSFLTTSTAKGIIQRIVTGYGETNNQFTSSDLDSTNLVAFDAANPQKLGVYLNQRVTVKKICDDIAASVGAQMVMNRAGELQLHKIDLPPSGTPEEITCADIIQDTLVIAERIPVIAAVKIGYAKNWTVQENIDTRIPQKHKDAFAKEWWSVTSEDSTTKTNYKLDAEPEQIDTFLIKESDASDEADRLLDLYKTQRHIYAFKGVSRLIELQLGDPVTITHDRFNLSGGKTGLVVGLSVDWKTLLVDVEIFA